MRSCRLAIIFSFFLLFSIGLFASPYSIGVYYFPGWKDGAEITRNKPWDVIKKFPEREPYLGWYSEGTPQVTAQHVSWMKNYGIKFIVYDWYWTSGKNPRLNHAIESYQKMAQRDVDFFIMWANHSDVPQNFDQFDSMVGYWIKSLFADRSYYSIDGRPAVMIFSPSQLQENAEKFGSTAKDLMARAQKLARAAGLPGIYFIGGVDANEKKFSSASMMGFDAFSAYNYHYGPRYIGDRRQMSVSYDELIGGYAMDWDWILRRSDLPYFLPVSSGWDRTPWEKTNKIDAHNNSGGNPLAFKRSLIMAKETMDRYPDKTKRTAIICCWNEFGEGSYIEPTKKDGFGFLKPIKEVFGN